MNLYDLAREVTDEILGPGAYADSNGDNHPDPRVREQVKISKQIKEDQGNKNANQSN